MPAWSVFLVVATALHLGFQLAVTLVVYPALVRTPAEHWSAAHARHSRSIAPLVVGVYGAALVGVGGALVADPGAGTVWLSALATAAAFAVTAGRAAPLHGRLGRGGPAPDLLAALVRADRLRTICAALALLAAAAPHVTV